MFYIINADGLRSYLDECGKLEFFKDKNCQSLKELLEDIKPDPKVQEIFEFILLSEDKEVKGVCYIKKLRSGRANLEPTIFYIASASETEFRLMIKRITGFFNQALNYKLVLMVN